MYNSSKAGAGGGVNSRGEESGMVQAVPIVYTIQGCDACVKLTDKWNAEGVDVRGAPRRSQPGDHG